MGKPWWVKAAVRGLAVGLWSTLYGLCLFGLAATALPAPVAALVAVAAYALMLVALS